MDPINKNPSHVSIFLLAPWIRHGNGDDLQHEATKRWPSSSAARRSRILFRVRGPRPKVAEICGDARSEEKKMVMGDANRWEAKIYGDILILYIIEARLSGWLEWFSNILYRILAFGGKNCKTWDDEDLFGKETMAGTIELYTFWPVARGSERHTFHGASWNCFTVRWWADFMKLWKKDMVKSLVI